MEDQGTPLTAPPRRLLRSRDERVIGGVCGGLGEYTGIDPVVFRIILAVSALAGGAGIIAYVIGWIAIPERNDDGSAPPPGSSQVDNVAAVVIGLLGLIVLVGFVGGHDRGPFDGDGGLLLLLLVGAGVWWWVRQDRAPAPEARPAPAATGLDDLLTTPVHPVAVQPARSRLPLVGLSALLLLWGALVLTDLTITEVDAQVAIGLSLATVGAVLVAGAWWGRGRGLVALGVILAVVGGFSSVVEVSPRGGWGERVWQADAPGELRSSYRLAGGDALLDLRDLELDADRQVDVDVWAGQLRIVLPPDVRVDVDAHLGMGEMDLFGEVDEGIDIDQRVVTGDRGGPLLRLDVNLGMGELEVRRGAA